MAPDNLPPWQEIRSGALGHLHTARTETSEAADWLRAIDTPLTDAQAKAAREARKLIGQIKDLIDQAKDHLEQEDGRG